MTMSDLRIGAGFSPETLAGGSSSTGEAGTGFGKILDKSLTAVNSQIQEANELAEGLVSGRNANIAETMLAMEKADISFRLLTQVQSKVVSAYQEIERLQF